MNRKLVALLFVAVGFCARRSAAGRAKAANIYWQVGSSATLGTTSSFKGNILRINRSR